MRGTPFPSPFSFPFPLPYPNPGRLRNPHPFWKSSAGYSRPCCCYCRLAPIAAYRKLFCCIVFAVIRERERDIERDGARERGREMERRARCTFYCRYACVSLHYSAPDASYSHSPEDTLTSQPAPRAPLSATIPSFRYD